MPTAIPRHHSLEAIVAAAKAAATRLTWEFRHGYNAHMKGRAGLADNPFMPRDPRHVEWRRGWLQAENDIADGTY